MSLWVRLSRVWKKQLLRLQPLYGRPTSSVKYCRNNTNYLPSLSHFSSSSLTAASADVTSSAMTSVRSQSSNWSSSLDNCKNTYILSNSSSRSQRYTSTEAEQINHTHQCTKLSLVILHLQSVIVVVGLIGKTQLMIVFIKAINRHTAVKHNAEHTDMLKTTKTVFVLVQYTIHKIAAGHVHVSA